MYNNNIEKKRIPNWDLKTLPGYGNGCVLEMVLEIVNEMVNEMVVGTGEYPLSVGFLYPFQTVFMHVCTLSIC